MYARDKILKLDRTIDIRIIVREVKLHMTITNISRTVSTYGFDTTHVLTAASGLAQFVI